MGIVNAGQLIVYEDIEPELLEHVEDVIFNRRADATERLVELAERVRGEGTRRERDLSWREAPVEKRLEHALVHGIVDFIEEDTEEARQKCRAPARRDRGPADGGHAGRRRPLRRGEDVPAAGREERARDEAGRRLPRAVHGGGEEPAPARDAGTRRARDRQGRRARHRQEHRRRRARLQQLRGARPRRDGAGRRHPRHRARGRRGRRRAVRPDHAVARPDGRRRARDGAPRARRCRCSIGGATTSRQHTAVRIAPEYSQPVVHVLDASRVVGVVSDLLDPAAADRRSTRRTASAQERLREQYAEKERKPLLPIADARANAERVSFDELDDAGVHRPARRRADGRDAARRTSTGSSSSTPGR